MFRVAARDPGPVGAARHRAERSRRKWTAIGIATVLAIVLGAGSAVLIVEKGGLAARLVGPYLERRASGHRVLIERAMGFVARTLVRLDRGETGPVQNDPN